MKSILGFLLKSLTSRDENNEDHLQSASINTSILIENNLVYTKHYITVKTKKNDII